MEKSGPLNDYKARKTQITINRLHAFIHGTALLLLFYYRFTSITAIITNRESVVPILPHVLILISELVLSFIWVLSQGSKWKPVVRSAYPERLPGDDQLPSIDVLVCTTDPNKEPSLGVMNTVISAMALDYPPHKLHVYLSDDGGSSLTFRAVKRAWTFSKLWIPFCRKYELTQRCPQAYFSKNRRDDDEDEFNSDDFLAHKKRIQKAYEDFKKGLAKIGEGASGDVSKDHPPLIEVIGSADDNGTDLDLPLLVYVAREKRPSHPHHFKAGALNVLLRVSALMSNSAYILVLDCDMYCNDPASARQAMCFHLHSPTPNLAFVQFPQTFHNISKADIYDGKLRYIWPKWEGFDGLRGPILSGTGFYIKREALYGPPNFQHGPGVEVVQLENYFGSSDKFINSIYSKSKINSSNERQFLDNALLKEMQLLASCSYDNDTKWGKEVGFRYFAVVEDYFTGFKLHCSGWTSVYYAPSRPCFLGASPTSLSEVLIQHTRWNVGLNQVALSMFSPLLYGPPRMPISQSMSYAELAYQPLYFLPLCILALVPQLSLLRRIPLYPQVSSPFFVVFLFLFLSAQLKHIQEVFETGHSMRTWLIEQRVWMMKSLTSYLYATLDAVREKIGLTKASFLPTNKVVDDEVEKRYQMGVYDFQASALFMVPLCSLYMLNFGSFVIGCGRILHARKGNDMLIQAFIALFASILHYPLLEGMVLRQDKGRVSTSVSVVSVVVSSVVLGYALLGSYY